MTRIYRDSDNDQFIVRFYENGKLAPDADYFTDDREDAFETSTRMVEDHKPQPTVEDTELPAYEYRIAALATATGYVSKALATLINDWTCLESDIQARTIARAQLRNALVALDDLDARELRDAVGNIELGTS